MRKDSIGVLAPTKERIWQWQNTFKALQNPNFRIFWFAQIISLTGNWMQIVSQDWLVYRLTGSPLMLGAVGFLALAPVLPISLLGGVIIDRLPKRRLLILTQSTLALCALAVALLTWSGIVQVWHVIVFGILFGAIGSVDLPTRQTFVTELVGKDGLMNAIALIASIFNVARIAGPALAGLLMGWLGEEANFFLNALSFVPLIIGLHFMRLPAQTERVEEQERSLTGGLVQGFKYIRGQSLILALMSLMAVSSLTVLPYLIVMPVFAQDVLDVGPQGLGFLVAAVGVGATLGALFAAGLGKGQRGSFLTVGVVLLPLSVIAFSLSRQFILSLIILVLVGIGTTWLHSALNTFVQVNVRDDMRGRVMSLYLMLYVGLQRVGGLQVGFMAEHIGVAWPLGLNAAVCLLFSLCVVWRFPRLRHLR